MKRLCQLCVWFGTMALAAFYWLAVTACDSSFEIQVNDITIAQGKAIGSATVNGKSRSFEGTVGTDGWIKVEIEGFKVEGHFQPGSKFTVKQGGVVIVQVPALCKAGVWKAANYFNGDTATIMLSDTLPGLLLYPASGGFKAEPGHKLLYGRLPKYFNDTLFMGSISGEFDFPESMTGPQPIKFLIAGILTVYMPFGGPGTEYIFPEFPSVHDFALVGSMRNEFPCQLVGGDWGMISQAEATSLGLSDPAGTQYIRLKLKGASASEVNSSFSLSCNGKEVSGGLVTAPVVGGDSSLIISFDRDEFYLAVDTTSKKQHAVLTGNLTSVPYSNRFVTAEDLAFSSLGVEFGEASRAIELFEMTPNPVSSSSAITYRIPAETNVRLTIHSMTGIEVMTLINDRQSAGIHSVQLDAGRLPSGTYTVELNAGGVRKNRTMIVVH